jgi:hypothetical protein
MTSVTVDKTQAEALVKTGELVEIRDASGTVLGFFAPVKQEYAEQYAEMAAHAFSVWGPEGRPKHLTTSADVIAYLQERESKK